MPKRSFRGSAAGGVGGGEGINPARFPTDSSDQGIYFCVSSLPVGGFSARTITPGESDFGRNGHFDVAPSLGGFQSDFRTSLTRRIFIYPSFRFFDIP